MQFSNHNQKELENLARRLKLNNISEALHFPKYFEVETIRACNAMCNMCPVWRLRDRGSIMSDFLFSKMTNEMKNYSDWIERVCLSRNGEPLLDPKLIQRIKMLKQAGIKEVSFSTNASLLDEEKSNALIQAGLDDLRFSIDGTTKETFEKVRKGLDFDKVVENCLRFIKLRDKLNTNLKIHVRMVSQEQNKHEEEDFKKFWTSQVSKNDFVTSKPMHSWGAQLENYDETEEENEKYSSVPCISPFGTMIVHFNGKVPLCGCDFDNKVLLGDLNNSTMKEIWISEANKKIRDIHASGNRNSLPLCKGCNIWDEEIKKVY
ncbi:MAG: radical SAM protein [archaeon]